MADHPGAFAYPGSYGLYGMYDAGPITAPPPTDFPGAYPYPLSPGMYGQLDGGPRTMHGDLGRARGGTTFPFNPNVRGIFKRFDPKQKPL